MTHSLCAVEGWIASVVVPIKHTVAVGKQYTIRVLLSAVSFLQPPLQSMARCLCWSGCQRRRLLQLRHTGNSLAAAQHLSNSLHDASYCCRQMAGMDFSLKSVEEPLPALHPAGPLPCVSCGGHCCCCCCCCCCYVIRDGHVTMDVSADLTELGRTPVTVVCAGAKSVRPNLLLPGCLQHSAVLNVPLSPFVGSGVILLACSTQVWCFESLMMCDVTCSKLP
jgi:hypothetical protein